MNIPPALLDRMEVIRLAGYTEDEKLNIAQRYLLPKQKQEQRRQGLTSSSSPKRPSAASSVTTRGKPACVRSSARSPRSAARSSRACSSRRTTGKAVVTEDNLNDFLGVRKYDFGRAEKKNQVGQVVGLAWTEVGGDLLTIEATP